MVELPPEHRRVTHVLRKGTSSTPATSVEPGVPRHCHPLPDGQPKNRLGLAQWLVDPRNPLTARVAVNRYWAQIFGIGLVETEEDFGTQGEPPSHPELLDWLAVRYRESGWDTKALLAADRHLGDLSPVVEGPARAAGEGPAQPAAGAGASGPARGRDGPRPGPGPERTLEPQGRRAERLPAAARRPLAGGVQRPAHLGDQPGRRPLPPRALHLLAADGAVSLDGRVRRPQPRDLRDPPGAHQHAAPVVRHPERPGLRRGRPGPGAADRPRGGRRRRSPRPLRPALCLCRPPRPEQVEPLVALYAAEHRALPQGPRRPPWPWPPTRSGRCPPAWSRPSWPPGPPSPTSS